MISVLILTYNEQANIAAAIESLPSAWRQDVHVLDSGSSDNTVEIAMAVGAKVTKRDFDNYAGQRNFGLGLPFANEWVVMLDADERMTPGLACEIEEKIVLAAKDVSMFRVRRRDIFMGRWLRRSSGYPTWFPRLFRRGQVQVERAINEVYVPKGKALQLTGHIEHHPFNNGMDWWFERHNRYSTMEAALLVARADKMPSLKALADPAGRRAALKTLVYRMPLRPFVLFAYLYLIRGGFLDGKPGWVYANMRLSYEIMIDAKAAFSRHRTVSLV